MNNELEALQEIALLKWRLVEVVITWEFPSAHDKHTNYAVDSQKGIF